MNKQTDGMPDIPKGVQRYLNLEYKTQQPFKF